MKPLFKEKQQTIELSIHIVIWILFLSLPVLFSGNNSYREFTWAEYLAVIKLPVIALGLFYLNYLLLVPHLLFNKQNKLFFLLNGILVVSLCIVIHLGDGLFKEELPPRLSQEESEQMRPNNTPMEHWNEEIGEQVRPAPMKAPRIPKHDPPPIWAIAIRDSILFICMIGISVAIRMNGKWRYMEQALQEAEKTKAEAVLMNLRSQLNPHFLLNTLNNIYALISFDKEKAQKAVQDLSKLLRYVLYENKEMYVPLSREMDFIRNYIELMRIRLSKDARVYININVPNNSAVQIAPMVFISLIENAFKHGISPSEPSFISISIAQVEQKEVRCEVLNSNHPKSNSDKSGSGIGLEQVQKRLDLMYPERYEWKRGISDNGEVYSSILTIQV